MAVSLALASAVIVTFAVSGGERSVRRSGASATRVRIQRRLTVRSAGALPTAVQDAAVASLDNRKAVLLGGLDSSQSSTATVSVVDGGSVTSGGRLSDVQHDAQAATIGGAVYVFGGGVTASYDHILRYEPTSGQVAQAGTLPRPASDVGVAALGGTAYIVGGFDGVQPLDTIVAWRPGAPARVVGHLPAGLRYPAVAAIGNRLVIAGGTDGTGSSDAVMSFDPRTGTVTQIGRLPMPLTHASSATLGGVVYVVGGRSATTGPQTDAILAIDPAHGSVSTMGRLPALLSDAAVVAVGGRIIVAGGETAGAPQRSIWTLTVHERKVVEHLRTAGAAATAISPALIARGFGTVLQANPGSISAYNAAARQPGLPGYLLIADRGNNRVLVVDPHGNVAWRYPTSADQAAGRRLRFNDDTFVVPGGQALIANEEDNSAIVSIGIADHNLHVVFGAPGVRGGGPDHMNYPDDAYALPDGSVTVADAYNCRILFVRARTIVRQYGRSGVCRHDPPRSFGAVNGDTPTPDGGVLVSEITGHWLDSLAADGTLRYSIQVPAAYPSDPQPLPNDQVLLADYARPGQVLVIDRAGRPLWRYAPKAGPGRLDHPSLALELPNGDIAVNDDYRDRIVIIDPKTRQIVWQYGHTDHAGTAPGYLNTPDGMDFIPAGADGQPDWAAVVHA